MTTNGFDISEIKDRARGRWATIYTFLANCDSSLFDGRHHPCPRCGGKDRFRYTNLDDDGSLFCNQCHRDGGDGISGLSWLNSEDTKTVLKTLSEHLNIGHKSNGSTYSPSKPQSESAATTKGDNPFLAKLAVWPTGVNYQNWEKPLSEFVAAKPPITQEAILAAGGIVAGWPVSNEHAQKCLAFFAYDSPGNVVGCILRRVDGNDFAAFSHLPERKTHMIGGSRDGWIILGGFERLKEAKFVWFVEGLPDELALYSHLPDDHCVLSNICGCGSIPANIEIFRDKIVLVVGDADEPGQAGAAKRAAAVSGIAKEVRIVQLPYEVDETHGRDLRDYFNDGNTFDSLKAIASAAEPIEKPTTSETTSDSAKIADALKTTIADIGNRINVGRDPYETLAELKKSIEKISNLIPVESFPVMTSAELDTAEFKTEYLIEHVLAARQPCILAASKKSLKTTIAIDLTLSLASGAKFLGQFYVSRPARVALFSGESGDATIQETARRIAKSKPWINLADYDNALWSFTIPKFSRPTTKSELIKFIKDQRIEVAIIDPAYLSLELGDEAGNLFQVGAKLIELTEIGQETGATIIIVHHNRKATREFQFESPELESIAWSGFQEWARQWILLGRREAYDAEQAGSHKLWLVTGGSAGHSGKWGVDVEEGSQSDHGGRRWEVKVEKASAVVADRIDQRENEKEQRAKQKESRQLEADSKKLLREYQRRPSGDTEKYFRERAGLSGTRASLANDKLVDDGMIEPCEIRKNGRAYPGFCVTRNKQATSGTDRDSTGTNPASPDEEHGAGLLPLRGSPGPAHRDIEQSVFMDADQTNPASPGQHGGQPA